MDTVPTQEGTFKSPDGHEFYCKTWSPPSGTETKARLVFIHGFSDHCNFYETLLNPLAAKGIKVWAFDQRGWGRSVHSPSQKGLTGPTPQVMQDITTFINTRSFTAEEEQLPLFLAGHSMGGGEVLTYAALGPADVTQRIRGFLCESPYVSLHPSSQPFRFIEVLCRFAGRFAPHFQMVQKLDPKKVCRDPAVIKRFEEDTLCHDTGTFEGLAGMLDRADDLHFGRVVLKEGRGEGGKTRLWIGHGTEDHICAHAGSKKFIEGLQVQDKELKSYSGWYHKLHSEPGQDQVQFADDFGKWILDRSGPLDGAKARL